MQSKFKFYFGVFLDFLEVFLICDWLIYDVENTDMGGWL